MMVSSHSRVTMMQKLFERGPATDQSQFVKLVASLMSTDYLAVQVEESDTTT